MNFKKIGIACAVLSGALLLGACGSSESANETNDAGVLIKDNNGYHGTFQNLTKAYDENASTEYLIYLYATSCPHCANNKAMINDYAVKDTALPIYGYDLDNKDTQSVVQGFIDKYGFTFEGTPTTVHIKDGEIANVLVGEQEIGAMPMKTKKSASEDESKTVSESEENSTTDGTTENSKETSIEPK